MDSSQVYPAIWEMRSKIRTGGSRIESSWSSWNADASMVMERAGGQDFFLLEGRETRNLSFRDL